MKLKYVLMLIIFSSFHKQQASWLSSGALPQSTQLELQQHPDTAQIVTTYPMTNLDVQKGTIQQIIQNRSIKATIAPGMVPLLQQTHFSTFRADGTEFKNYPTGSSLFPDQPTVAAKFDALLALLQKHPQFIPFVRKIHLNVLNELYEHLMNIYTNFNLQEPGIKTFQTGGKKITQASASSFLHHENLYEQNKKTLIINHLVNIIESQLNGAIKAIMPNIPHMFATYSGKVLIQNDYSVDITQFIIKQITPNMKQYKKLYLQTLGTYLDFFQEYTAQLMQPSKKNQHFTAFVDMAENINEFIYGKSGPQQITSSDQKTKQLLAKMNPPMFTFSYDDIRALKLIPHLAKSLQKSQKVTWPSHIAQAADNGTMINNCPIAFFRDDNNTVVRQAAATKLFVVLRSGKNFFEEELLQEPDWLSSWTGIANILQACFGNLAALVGLEILDPCTEAVIKNAIALQQGTDTNSTDPVIATCRAISNKKTQASLPINQKPSIPKKPSISKKVIPNIPPPPPNNGPGVSNIPGVTKHSGLTPPPPPGN